MASERKEFIHALYCWLLAKVRQLYRYDLKGDLQMQERAARQDLIDAWWAVKP